MVACIKFLEREVIFKHKGRDITLHVNEKGHTIPLVSHDSFDMKSFIFAYMIFVKGTPNSTDISPNGSFKVDKDLHSFLSEHVKLCIDDNPDELPPKRGDDDHRIDLIPRISPPNKPPYQVSQAQQEEVMNLCKRVWIKLLSRPKRLLNETIQGVSGLRVRVFVPMLYNFVELQQRRLCVRCSLGHGPEDKDFSNKQNGDAYDKSQRTLAVSSGSTISLTKRIVIRGLKVIISLMVMLSLALVGTPFALSSRLGRRSVLSVFNKFIPGQIDVQSLSLGWTKPVRAGGISLKGVDKKVVLSILKLETQASLWSLIRGKSGLEIGS
ncbi:hypothetical protein L7F22_065352 [Adiantum nelumboides]|nr:hypothetical protein [Adiantum nelumboides]